jgi:Ni2+-binding GTPase involved in maturation of urease and hydrogenase
MEATADNHPAVLMMLEITTDSGKSETLRQIIHQLKLSSNIIVIGGAMGAMVEMMSAPIHNNNNNAPIITTSLSNRNKGDVFEMRKREKKAQQLETKTRNRGKWK